MPVNTVNATTLKQWLDKDEAVIIDVREPAENAAESIPGAILIPYATVSLQSVPEVANKKLVLHCHGGGRSGRACAQLVAANPDLEIYNLEGGITAWKNSGAQIKQSGSFFLPLDRQVQITVGVSILLGVLCGFTVDSGFFIVPAIFGFGLTVAGLTGTCLLGVLMAKMPWNN